MTDFLPENFNLEYFPVFTNNTLGNTRRTLYAILTKDRGDFDVLKYNMRAMKRNCVRTLAEQHESNTVVRLFS